MPHKDQQAKRDYMREYVRRRRKEDPEFRKLLDQRTMASRRKPEGARKHAESNARYKERYPERVKALLKEIDTRPHRVAYRAKYMQELDKTILRSWQKKWREQRSLQKNKNGGTCTVAQWRARCELYGHCCAYCNRPLEESKIEKDHVIPVARGGTGWPSNLVPACRSCNAHKNAARWKPKLPPTKLVL